MTQLRDLVLATVMFASFSANAAVSATRQYAPGNQPAPGTTITPDYTNSGQGLGLAILGAHVFSDGTMANGVGTTGSSYLAGLESYQIDFNRDVSKCIYSTTPFSDPVTSLAEPRLNSLNSVFVVFANLSKTKVKEEFYLTVICNQ